MNIEISEEIWKDIPNFVDKYEISNTGKVRNKKRGNLLKVNSSGTFHWCDLTIDSKHRKMLNVIRTLDQLFDFHVYSGIYSVVDLDGEIWKPVVGFESKYMVSNKGRVKGLTRYVRCNTPGKTMCISEKLKTQGEDGDGYLRVSFYDGSKVKSLYTHRVVANAFIPNIYNKEQVNHIDGNKKNNHVENLEWVTNLENMNHSWRIGLRGKVYCYPIRCIDTGETFKSMNVLVKKYNSSYYSLHQAIRNHALFFGHYYEYIYSLESLKDSEVINDVK